MRRSKTVFPCVYANTNFKNSFSFFYSRFAETKNIKIKNIVIKLISPSSSENFELS